MLEDTLFTLSKGETLSLSPEYGTCVTTQKMTEDHRGLFTLQIQRTVIDTYLDMNPDMKGFIHSISLPAGSFSATGYWQTGPNTLSLLDTACQKEYTLSVFSFNVDSCELDVASLHSFGNSEVARSLLQAPHAVTFRKTPLLYGIFFSASSNYNPEQISCQRIRF